MKKRILKRSNERSGKVVQYTDFTKNIAEKAQNSLYNGDVEDKLYEPPLNLFGFFGELFKP